jgi:hypothetical protein
VYSVTSVPPNKQHLECGAYAPYFMKRHGLPRDVAETIIDSLHYCGNSSLFQIQTISSCISECSVLPSTSRNSARIKLISAVL